MGVVWEARHALLRRPTAVKLLAPGTEGERSLARFEREVQLTAGLTHPSTIAIYDYGRTADGVFYYAMELLRGINLLQLVDFDGPLPAGARRAPAAPGLRRALPRPTPRDSSTATSSRPNLMICRLRRHSRLPEGPRLRSRQGHRRRRAHAPGRGRGIQRRRLSQDGSLLGTPLYMAPEGMSDPSKVDARADLFALGAVGYFLLTGQSPFPGRTAIEVFQLERQGPPAPLSKRRAEVPCLPRSRTICAAASRSTATTGRSPPRSSTRCSRPAPSNRPGRTPTRGPGGASGAGPRSPPPPSEHEEREERGQFLMLSSDFGGREVGAPHAPLTPSPLPAGGERVIERCAVADLRGAPI